MAVAEPILSPELHARRMGRLRWRRADQVAIAAIAVVTLLALIGPTLAPHDPAAAVGPPLHAPSGAYPFGTDDAGRDVFSRTLSGIQATWLSTLLVIASGVVIGGIVGLVAGAAGGWLDEVLMRVSDVFLALPGFLLAIAIAAALGPSLQHALLALILVWWPYYARLVRAEIRALAARDHLEAARLAGTSLPRRLFRHLLPGALPVIAVVATLDIASVVLTLAALSFVGVGARPPAPELGSMISAALPFVLTAWWVAVVPALAVFLLSLLGNLAGDQLRELVDKK